MQGAANNYSDNSRQAVIDLLQNHLFITLDPASPFIRCPKEVHHEKNLHCTR